LKSNRAASVRARLKQQADAKAEAFDLVLTRFALERLLYRMSVSKYADDFLLKGALLFSIWFEHPHRATRDADLLGFGSSDVAAVKQKFGEIIGIACDDGIEFDTTSVTASEIRKQDGYGGVRVDIKAKLDGARISVQVDLGFGDVVTPGADHVTYPVLLGDFPAPQLRAYPRYTVIAEKLHAICLLGMTNSRMKDYFDLMILSQETGLDKAILATAIAATFKRRKTPPLPEGMPVGLTDVFAKESAKQRQWRAFISRNQLDAPSLDECVARLRVFLERPLAQARTIGAAT
jgi:hypothetical protein